MLMGLCQTDQQVELLLKSWADIEQADAGGVTPLLGAVLAGATDCVELLLAAGCNWLVEDNKGRTIAMADEVGSEETRSRRLDAMKVVELWAEAHPKGPSAQQQD
jgi:hypothetical protein